MKQLKLFIKKQKWISGPLFRIYLQLMFLSRLGKTYLISLLVNSLRRLVIKKDVTSLTISNNTALLSYYGKTFHWNPDDRDSLLGMAIIGSYEKKEISKILEFITDGMTVFDIGANYGLHSLKFAEKAGVQGHVYSFEPLKTMYDELEKNIVINQFTNRVSAVNVGLSDKKGTAILYIAKSLGTGATSLRKRWLGANDTQKCDLITLDSFVAKHKIKNVDFIKCDVEGGEYSIFKGARKTLSTFQPILFFEAIDNHTKLFQYTILEEMNYLKSFSYNFYLINGTKLKKVTNFINGNYFAFPSNYLKRHKV